MNPWQMAKQIQAELRLVSWAAGATNKVFGARNVHAIAGDPTEEHTHPGFPFALIRIDTGEADADHPELITQGYTILTAVNVDGDPLGSHAILGGARSNIGKSVGRGILEVGERVRSAVQNLLGIDGATIKISTSTTGSPKRLGLPAHVVLDELNLSAMVTSTLHYTAPQQLNHSSGDWTWAGGTQGGGTGHVASRFDFLQYRLLRKSGSSPSSSPSDGTVVTTQTTTTFTGAASAGNTYTIFADYRARSGDSAIDGSSDPEVGAYKVIPV